MPRTPTPSEQIGDKLTESIQRVKIGLKWTHGGLVLLGTFAVAVASIFIEGAPSWPPSGAQIVIFCGAILAFCGGVLALYVEEDPRAVIDIARREAMAAEDAERLALERLSILEKYGEALERLKSLYLVMSSTRGVVESAIVSGWISSSDQDSEKLMIQSVLDEARFDIRVSFGFEMRDFWTIVAYRTERDEDGAPVLSCIAHLRSVECSIDNARDWPIGVGIGGMALAKNREVVAPDLSAPKVGSAYNLSDKVKRETDDEYYKSMFAVPISVGDDDLPWGVVVVTSNKRSHFGSADPEGLAPEESARALAGIFALIVAVGRE